MAELYVTRVPTDFALERVRRTCLQFGQITKVQLGERHREEVAAGKLPWIRVFFATPEQCSSAARALPSALAAMGAPGVRVEDVGILRLADSYVSRSLDETERKGYRAAGIVFWRRREAGGRVEILLGKETRKEDKNLPVLSLLAGKRDPEDDGEPAATAAREFWEETGTLFPLSWMQEAAAKLSGRTGQAPLPGQAGAPPAGPTGAGAGAMPAPAFAHGAATDPVEAVTAGLAAVALDPEGAALAAAGQKPFANIIWLRDAKMAVFVCEASKLLPLAPSSEGGAAEALPPSTATAAPADGAGAGAATGAGGGRGGRRRGGGGGGGGGGGAGGAPATPPVVDVVASHAAVFADHRAGKPLPNAVCAWTDITLSLHWVPVPAVLAAAQAAGPRSAPPEVRQLSDGAGQTHILGRFASETFANRTVRRYFEGL
jgi:hypothetical protein